MNILRSMITRDTPRREREDTIRVMVNGVDDVVTITAKQVWEPMPPGMTEDDLRLVCMQAVHHLAAKGRKWVKVQVHGPDFDALVAQVLAMPKKAAS